MRIEIFNVRTFKFLCEQDGKPERELKARWLANTDLLRNIQEAFLVRVQYDGAGDPVVALALVTEDERKFALALAAAMPDFQSVMGRDVFLDVLRLSAEQQAEVTRVARPFLPPPPIAGVQ